MINYCHSLIISIPRSISPSISRRASVISRCSNYPAFTSLANRLAKLSVHAPFPHVSCSSEDFPYVGTVAVQETLFAVENTVPDAWFFPHDSTVALKIFRTVGLKPPRKHCSSDETLFQRGNHCSRAEITVHPRKNRRSQWNTLFIHAARRSHGTLLPLSKLV